MPDLRERWRSGWFEATAYDWVVEHRQVARVLGRAVWGIDAQRFYSEIARLGDLPNGARILDIPCGGGVAFRGVHPEQQLAYVAADLSPVMLRRARAEAERRRLPWIEFSEADVEALPFAEGTFDLCVTYTGLHCFGDPAAAIGEMARVLTPGGELRGTTILRETGLPQDAFVRFLQARALFGPGLTTADLHSALGAAGLTEISTRRDGALAYFSARQPAAA